MLDQYPQASDGDFCQADRELLLVPEDVGQWEEDIFSQLLVQYGCVLSRLSFQQTREIVGHSDQLLGDCTLVRGADSEIIDGNAAWFELLESLVGRLSNMWVEVNGAHLLEKFSPCRGWICCHFGAVAWCCKRRASPLRWSGERLWEAG